jgi:hypothetical protein
MAFLVLALLPMQAVTAPDKTGPDRLQSVEMLVESSSAARKVEESGNAEAMAKRDRARELYEQARKAAEAGKATESEEFLRQATAVMYEAVRIVGKDESLVVKDHRDFESRLESINALCDAYNRINEEKGLPAAESSELYPLVQSKLSQAKALKAEGDVLEGRKLLDEAYVAAKVAIEHLRGGDTLVRSLNFSSKEEEYHYEVDRNDTHRMLVTVLLKEKMRDNESVKDMVAGLLDKADVLRRQAETQASEGSYDTAVDTLELSTKEIVRAIRSAGVYIPG